MKIIVICGLIGAMTMPLVFIMLSYAFGLTIRPDGMSLQEAFRSINEGTWRPGIILGEILPVWMPLGGILGVLGYAWFRNRQRSDSAKNA